MTPRAHTVPDYDPLRDYSVAELVDMYLRQGLPATEAQSRAELVHCEIKALNQRERRAVRKFREHEIPVGLRPTRALAQRF